MRFIELFAGIGGFRYGLERVVLEHAYISEKPQQEKCEQRRVGTTDQSGIQLLPRNNSAFHCVWANEWDKYAAEIYRKNFSKEDIRSPKSKVQHRSEKRNNAQNKLQQRKCLDSGVWGERSKLYEGDITKIETRIIPDHELLVGGFPCQAFSIAGKRGGFDDTRGTLFFEIARILRDKRPECVLLENVKGLLSHDSGKTFQTILKVLSDIGYRTEWQVLNSKNFGVPQNRERVFIVGHLRGECRQQIFPIRENNEIGVIKNGDKIQKPFNMIKGAQSQYSNQNFIKNDCKVRRLTPIECERLQGFPDRWTEGISDTQRYKCLGNAVTTNVITKIGLKIMKQKMLSERLK